MQRRSNFLRTHAARLLITCEHVSGALVSLQLASLQILIAPWFHRRRQSAGPIKMNHLIIPEVHTKERIYGVGILNIRAGF